MKVTNSTRVCSAHFAPGCSIPCIQSKSLKPAVKERRPILRQPLRKKYKVPSLANLAKCAVQHEFQNYSVKCFDLRETNDQLRSAKSKLDSTVALLESQLKESHMELQHLQEKVEVSETNIVELVKHHSELTTELLKQKAMNKEHVSEVEKLTKAMNVLSLQHELLTKEVSSYKDCKYKLRVENFTDNDSGIQFYTGFSSWKMFIVFFNSLEPYEIDNLEYFGRERTFPPGKKRGPPRALNPLNEYFLTLIRLKLGLQERDIADRFGISQGTVSVIFNTWLSLLYHHLSKLDFWPSQDSVKKLMPNEFSDTAYANTRIIIDATELFIEKPSDLSLQSVTWSNYKSHNTLKGLVGISPYGGVTFVSELWAGSISDIELTKKSGLLDRLEPGDNVMADKGFNIEELLQAHHITLNIPPFMKNGALSENDVILTRSIASLRIHVERAIERIKNFRILTGTIPNSIHGSTVNKMFFVCSMLTNMQCPLVKPGSSQSISRQELKKRLQVSPAIQKEIELRTKEQSDCKLWHSCRSMRLTSSNFGRIFKRRENHDTLVKELFSTNKMFARERMPPPLKWGVEHEPVAFKEYAESLAVSHPTLKVTKSGLWIDLKRGWLACSPDGLVWNGDKLVGILEIKCPYAAREMAPVEACTKLPSFSCKLSEGGVKLVHSNNYYFQVQGQLAITGADWCDFCIYTPVESTM